MQFEQLWEWIMINSSISNAYKTWMVGHVSTLQYSILQLTFKIPYCQNSEFLRKLQSRTLSEPTWFLQWNIKHYDGCTDVHLVQMWMCGTYQRVTTSLEYVFVGTDFALASPKSASFKSPASLISRFWGLRSLKGHKYSKPPGEQQT